MFEVKRTAVTVLALLAALPSCNLLVDVPTPKPLPPPEGAVAPLTAGELLRFTIDNLGEVSPGLLYRSRQPDRELLEFLHQRVNLGHVINLRGSTEPEVADFMKSIGGQVTQTRMSVRRPPTVDQILQLIRVTHLARSQRQAILIHCQAGADRTGVMVGIWRMLFQGVRDLEELKWEAVMHRNLETFVPMSMATLRRFRPELFLPFVQDPTLLDDEERIAELRSRYFMGQPLLSGATRLTKGPLGAGTGKSDLLEGWQLPIQMATYGPSPPEATGLREPVYARALVLENGSVRLAIVSCDLLIMDAVLRQLVLERLTNAGVTVDDLLLAATHTHTSVGGYVDHAIAETYIMGPFQEAIREHLVDRIEAAILEALGDVRPARLGAGRTFVQGLSFNRRLGSTVDPEVGVLKITDKENQPIAVVINFAAHPILEPSDRRISADYPGLLTRHLDEGFNFGLFLNGALGDLNASAEGQPGVWQREGLAQQVADRLAQAVEEVADSIPLRSEVELGSLTALLELPSTNVGLVPDLLFPLEWWVAGLLDWPRYAPLQAVRIGETAWIAGATEMGVRLGLEIKRRSPSPFPFIVTHANAYGGYAVTQVNYGKRKLDPTSVVCLNGSTYGRLVVERACDLLEVHWQKRLDPHDTLLSPAATARLDLLYEEARGEIDKEQLRIEAIRHEEEATLARADPTLGQSRRLHGTGTDTIPDRLRLEISQLYLEDRRGGQRLDGRRRETAATVRWRLPWELTLGVSAGYVRSDWKDPTGIRDSDDGAADLSFSLERPFLLLSDDLEGLALRLVPVVAVSAPTGKANLQAPFAFAPAAGVFRPAAGGTLELTWNTYRTLSLDSKITTAIDRHRGRRPGELWESALRYSERHGIVSLLLDMVVTVQFEDSRHGGRLAVDVDETSTALGIRPGLSIHLGDHLELLGQARFGIARSGSGNEEGKGGVVGLMVGF